MSKELFIKKNEVENVILIFSSVNVIKISSFSYYSNSKMSEIIDTMSKVLIPSISKKLFPDERNKFTEEALNDLYGKEISLNELLEKITDNKEYTNFIDERFLDQNIIAIHRVLKKDIKINPHPSLSYNLDLVNSEDFYYKGDEFILKLIKSGFNKAAIKCVKVAKDFEKENKPLFRHFKLKTKNKIRDIYAPEPEVKECLKEILLILNASFENREQKTNQFAYRPNKSIYDNVVIHKNNKYVLKTDISSFFESCPSQLAKKYLKYALLRSEEKSLCNDTLMNKVLDVLEPMFINKETQGLYMGSPISGVLSNMIIKPAVYRMQNIFRNLNFDFSVYADDITVSSPTPINKKFIIKIIEESFEYFDLPFELKEEKTKYLKNNGRRITGVRINHLNQMTVNRKEYAFLKSVLEHLQHGKEITIGRKKLEGKINYYLFIDQSGKFKKLINKYYNVLSNYGIVIRFDRLI